MDELWFDSEQGKAFYLLQNLKPYPAFFSMDNGGSFSRVKEFMHEAGHFPPFSAEFENAWSFISTPLICLHGMHKDRFTLLYFTEEQTLWSSGEVVTILEKPAASIFRGEEMSLNPEDRGSRFALKSDVYRQNRMATHPSRQQSS